MNEKYGKILKKELRSLNQSGERLKKTYSNCLLIGIKSHYLDPELDQFEVLSARFSRTSDLFLQKLLRLIDLLEYNDAGTVIDRINRAEKRKLIPSADLLSEIRFVRNVIAHEYEPDDIMKIFKKVLDLTPHLIDAIEKTQIYGEELIKSL